MQLIKLLFLFVAISLVSCQRKQKTDDLIRIGVPKNVNYALLWIAKEKGIFEEQKIRVELQSDDDVTVSYKNGKVDLIGSTLTEPILLNSEGINTQIIYRFSYTSGNDVVIGQPKLKNLSELKGKTISFDGVNSSSHIFVEEVLDKNGVREGDYKTKNLSLENMISDFKAGKIQAGHTNIRYIHSLKDSEYTILARSSDLPDLVTEVLSGKTKFLKNHSLEIKSLINSLLLAQDYYSNHKEECIEILSKLFSKDRESIASEIQSIRFLSREENLQSLGTAKQVQNEASAFKTGSFHMNQDKKGALFLAAETMIQFLRTRGQLYKNPDLNLMIVNKYLEKM